MKGKIYKLINNKNNNIYVGSTCKDTIETILVKHKYDYNRYLKTNTKYITSFEIIKNNNYKIELIEELDINEISELQLRECYWIDKINCINNNKPNNYINVGRSNYNKLYKEKDKDNFNVVICNCGGKYSYEHKSHHSNSKYCRLKKINL